MMEEEDGWRGEGRGCKDRNKEWVGGKKKTERTDGDFANVIFFRAMEKFFPL